MARKKIDEAKENWERQMKTAPKYWKSAVDEAIADDRFCKGIAEFVGVKKCNPIIGDKWKTRVGAVSEKDYEARVTGKGAVWKKNYIKKMIGGEGKREEEEE